MKFWAFVTLRPVPKKNYCYLILVLFEYFSMFAYKLGYYLLKLCGSFSDHFQHVHILCLSRLKNQLTLRVALSVKCSVIKMPEANTKQLVLQQLSSKISPFILSKT